MGILILLPVSGWVLVGIYLLDFDIPEETYRCHASWNLLINSLKSSWRKFISAKALNPNKSESKGELLIAFFVRARYGTWTTVGTKMIYAWKSGM